MTKPAAIAAGAVFDLAAADLGLRSEAAYNRDGHTARTLVREPAMRVVLVVIRAGAKIDEHRSGDTASIHALTGHIRLGLPDHTVDLAAGRLLVIAPGVTHGVEAVSDSAFLLTRARGEHE